MSMPKPMSTIHLADQYFQPKIDLIQHLIQYSQNILLILAPQKGGKTAFANFCLTHSTPELKKHFLLVTPDLSIESMMDNIANGFGMSWPSQAPSINQAVQKIWTLFVDDAHLLSSDKLEALVRLVNFHQEPKRQLHLVLLGEDQLAHSFSTNRIKHLVGSYSTIIELALPQNWQLKSSSISTQSEFSLKSTRDFEENLEHAFENPIEPDPFFEMNIDLLEDRSDQAQQVGTSSYKNLFFHPVAYGLYLGLMVGVGVLIWQAHEAAPNLIEEPQKLALAVPEPEPEPELEMILPEPALYQPPVVINHQPKIVINAAPLKQANTQSIIKPKPKPKPKPKAKPIAHRERPSKQPQLSQSAEKIILAKNSSHYTIQLYSSNEAQKVAHFKQLHKLNKAWVIHKKHQGKVWHILVLGDYSTKAEAGRAIAQLPNSMIYQAKIKPWVREFTSVQKEILTLKKPS